MKMYANLHTHSTHSDGVHSPEMMVKVAKEEGVSAIAISDHDAGIPTVSRRPKKRGCVASLR